MNKWISSAAAVMFVLAAGAVELPDNSWYLNTWYGYMPKPKLEKGPEGLHVYDVQGEIRIRHDFPDPDQSQSR